MKETVYARLNSYAMERTIMEPDNECLTWIGTLRAKKGSSNYVPTMNNVLPKSKSRSAVRYTWELFRSKLSRHDLLRNVCGNRACINPYHYNNVSEACPRGHKRTPDNVLMVKLSGVDSEGNPKAWVAKGCRVCKRLERNRRYHAGKK
jgi:hypothetical protein